MKVVILNLDYGYKIYAAQNGDVKRSYQDKIIILKPKNAEKWAPLKYSQKLFLRGQKSFTESREHR